MISRLYVQNIALVETAEVFFKPGMSVVTGETGAGKSVIVNALALVFGGRAEKEMIRHGADYAVVEATFDVSRMPARYRTEYEDYLMADTFTVRREINRDGNSKVRINDEASTVTRLKELTTPIGEILGQNANQMLMDEENHIIFLDNFADLTTLRYEVNVLYHEWRTAASELKKLSNARDELKNNRELLVSQQHEIKNAQIRVGEEAELVAERKKLDASRALMESASRIQHCIEADSGGAQEQISSIQRELDKMLSADDTLHPAVKQAADISFQLEELRANIERYGSTISDNPARIEEINQRLDEIYQLKRKFGGSEESILERLAEIEEALLDRPDADAQIARLQEQEQQAREAYTNKATTLTGVRAKAAEYLKKLVVKELAELAIEQSDFACQLIYEEHPKGVKIGDKVVRPLANGLETARFLFSANQGEPLKSLVKTASGGEVSRVLLALKSAEKKNSKALVPVMVFDEIDAGIGGQTANEVAQKLRKLSEAGQVFVITHLHQIARVADQHYGVQKKITKDGRSVITVVELDAAGITVELDRMVALPEAQAVPGK